MNYSAFRLSLDIHRQTTQAHLAVKKGDTARKIIASLSDGGRPYRINEGCYAVFRGKKADGNVLYNNCAIENNCIVYEFTEQTAASAGYMACEIRLYGADDQLITSPRFAIIVSGLVYDDSEVESTAEFTALSQAMTDLAELKANGLKGDTGPQGPIGPQGPQGPQGESDVLYVTLIQSGDGSWVSEDYYDDIRRAYEAKRPMVCLIELTNTEQAWLELPLVKMGNGGVFFFSAVCEGTEWLVTLSRNPEDDGTVVTVETNVHPVTGTTLRDQVTGEIFTLYMDDADLHIVPGGKPTGARDQILLVDRTTGENYTISISNGVPMLESEV